MAIECRSECFNDPSAIAAFFEEAFSDSEGADEGSLIGDLAGKLVQTTPVNEIAVFSAYDNGNAVGCIIFTRLWFGADQRRVFLLSPVAVSPKHQGLGIGTRLINFALDALRQTGGDLAVTYGDPDYYKRVGFRPIRRNLIPPPLPLQQPHGWLAQSLTDDEIHPFDGPSRCAEALNDPAYW